MVDLPKSIFKYVSADGVRIVESLKIRFTKPCEFNDPFDMRPVMGTFDEGALLRFQKKAADRIFWKQNLAGNNISRRTFDEQTKQVEEETTNRIRNNPSLIKTLAIEEQDKIFANIGILCLTENESDILMWSHYAESHKGLLIEFDPQHPFFGDSAKIPGRDFDLLSRVCYSSDRPKMAMGGQIDPSLFITKSSHWAYENEWRMFKHLKTQPAAHKEGKAIYLFDIPAECIRRVVLGWHVHYDTSKRLFKAKASNPSLRHVMIQQAREDTDKFALIYDTL